MMNEIGRQVGEQYAYTAGFTGHLSGASVILGYQLALRIRNLSSKRLYIFNPVGARKDLHKLVGGNILDTNISRRAQNGRGSSYFQERVSIGVGHETKYVTTHRSAALLDSTCPQ